MEITTAYLSYNKEYVTEECNYTVKGCCGTAFWEINTDEWEKGVDDYNECAYSREGERGHALYFTIFVRRF
jgi:hypothetical protein